MLKNMNKSKDTLDLVKFDIYWLNFSIANKISK